MQNRWKSKTMWAGILGSLALLYNAVAENFSLPTIGSQAFEPLINFILTLLVTLGVLNNPTDSKKF